MDDPATLFSRDHKFTEVRRIDQQLTLFVAVFVRHDDGCGLPRVLQNAIGKHLDTGECQVGYTFELLHDPGQHFKIGRLAFGVGEHQCRNVRSQFAIFCKLSIKRQYPQALLGCGEVKQRVARSSVRGSVHPGSHAVLIVDPHRLAGGLEHHFGAGRGNLAPHLVPARLGKKTGWSEVCFMTHIALLVGWQTFDQCGINFCALEHRVIGPAGMPVDTAQDQRLVGPTAVIENLPQLTGLFPVSRTDPGNIDHIPRPRRPRLVLLDDPLLKFGQRFFFVEQIRPKTVQTRDNGVAVGINHPRHQHLASQIDTLGPAVGQCLDFGIAAHLDDLAVFHRHSVGQWLARHAGKYLAIGEHQVGCGQGLQRRERKQRSQHTGSESLHWDVLFGFSCCCQTHLLGAGSQVPQVD